MNSNNSVTSNTAVSICKNANQNVDSVLSDYASMNSESDTNHEEAMKQDVPAKLPGLGLKFMSLKEVLSKNQNLNLSIGDLKKLSAQLSQQNDRAAPSCSKWDVGIKQESVDTNLVMSTVDLVEVKSENGEVKLEDFSDNLEETTEQSTISDSASEANLFKSTEHIKPKRRGGWPKGRKRKPDPLPFTQLPPKPPKTSYNIFLKERRKLYKDKLMFHEVTRIVGNQWSNLTPQEKKPYIDKAEEDKRRYREELRAYHQSESYQMFLTRKRKKRFIDNLLSESDMDATDEIDEEDSDLLYCDICNQVFHNLHNKNQHLLGRQHKMLVAGELSKELASSDGEGRGNCSSVSFSTSLDESSMDAAPLLAALQASCARAPAEPSRTVLDHMAAILGSVLDREREIKELDKKLRESILKQNSFLVELSALKEKCNDLRRELSQLQKNEVILEQLLYNLWNVPNMFMASNP